MTIEFPCPQCSQLVRTPDAAAGKKGKCPSCQAVMQIPALQTPAAKQLAAPAVAQPTEDTGPIEFFCNFCGQVVRTPRVAAGKKGKCPHCSEVVLIPLTNPPKPAATAVKPATPQPTLKKPAPAVVTATKPAATAPAPKPAPQKPATALQPLAPLTPLASLTPLSSGGDLFGGPAAATKPAPQPPAAKATPRPAPPAQGATSAALAPLTPLSPLGGSSAASGGDLFGGAPLPASNAAQPSTPLAPLAPLGAAPAVGDLFGGGSFSANPYADSSYKPVASAPPSDASLNIPAIIQLVVVVPFLLCYLIYFGLCMLSLVFSAFTLAAVNPQFRSLAMSGFMYNLMWTVLTLVFMVGQCVIIFGSVRQLERKGLLMAQVGAWLSVVPCVSPMGMPAGIWSLVGLYRDEVKRSFRS
jgi:phage FluMu protein Com